MVSLVACIVLNSDEETIPLNFQRVFRSDARTSLTELGNPAARAFTLLPQECVGVSDLGTSWRQGTKLPKDSHQFIEEFLVVVADAENVLLILFGQGALLRRAVS